MTIVSWRKDFIMSKLKQFQDDAVECIYNYLNDKENNHKAAILAFETGLGKTNVAQGVIEKRIANSDQVTESVTYICSELALAEKNARKLEELNFLNLAVSRSNAPHSRYVSQDRLSLQFLDEIAGEKYKKFSILKGAYCIAYIYICMHLDIFNNVKSEYENQESKNHNGIFVRQDKTPLTDNVELFKKCFCFYNKDDKSWNYWADIIWEAEEEIERENYKKRVTGYSHSSKNMNNIANEVQKFYDEIYGMGKSDIKDAFDKADSEGKSSGLECAINNFSNSDHNDRQRLIKNAEKVIVEYNNIAKTKMLYFEINRLTPGVSINAITKGTNKERTLAGCLYNEYDNYIKNNNIKPQEPEEFVKTSGSKNKIANCIMEQFSVFCTGDNLDYFLCTFIKKRKELYYDLNQSVNNLIAKYSALENEFRYIFYNQENKQSDSDLVDLLNKLNGTSSKKLLTKLQERKIDNLQKLLSEFDYVNKLRNEFFDNEKGFEYEIGVEAPSEKYIGIRKAMISTTIEMRKSSLLIIDEFQRYPDIFRSDVKKGSIADKLFHGNDEAKILMLSATPFKYHTRIAVMENEQHDDIADGTYPVFTGEDIRMELSTSAKGAEEEYNNIIGYMCAVNNVDNDMLEKALKAVKDDDKLEGYTEAIKKMSDALKSIGIWRKERLSCQPDIQKRLVVETVNNRVIDSEIFSCPEAGMDKAISVEYLNELFKDKSKDVHYIIDYDWLRCYIDYKGTVYKINEDIKDLIELYYYDDEENGKDAFKYKLYPVEDDGRYYFKVEFVGCCMYSDGNSMQSILSFQDETPFMYSFITPGEYNGIKGDVKTPDKLYKLKTETIQEFKKIKSTHVAFNQLDEDMVSGWENLLFIPSIKPHYKLYGPYEGKEGLKFGKTLIFNEYRCSARALGALLSYEADYRVVKDCAEKKYDNYKKLKIDIVDKDADKIIEEYVKRKYNLYLENSFPEYSDVVRKIEDVEKLCKKDNFVAGSPIGYIVDKIKNDNLLKEDNEAVIAFSKAVYKIFSTPSALLILNEQYQELEKDFFSQVEEYCTAGNIRSVLDEYFFMIDNEDSDKDLNYKINKYFVKISENRQEPLSVRTSDENGQTVDIKILQGFAVQHNSKDNATALLNKISKFNSPFRPFVFSITSMAQEGLDFHWYADRIVHWHLSLNPVELEQREGRIDRYNSYHIRNAVWNSVKSKVKCTNKISWKNIFKCAEEQLNNADANNGLAPNWEFNGAKIHRYIYFYPESTVANKYEKLVEACAYYRSLLGCGNSDNMEEKIQGFIKNIKDDCRKNGGNEFEEIRKLYVDLTPPKK